MVAPKSRIGREPPPSFLSQILVTLSRIFVGYKIDAEHVAKLLPAWTEMYRLGYNAARIAQTTCSCDGHSIVPAPGALVGPAPRGSARAPKGRLPGQAFGLADVQESRPLSRKRSEVAIALAQVAHYQAEVQRKTSRKAQDGLQKWETALGTLQRELEDIEAQAAWTNPAAAPVAVKPRKAKPQKAAAPEVAPAESQKPRSAPRQRPEPTGAPGAVKAAATPKPARPAKPQLPPKKAPCGDCREGAKAPELNLDEIGDEINALAGGFDAAAGRDRKG